MEQGWIDDKFWERNRQLMRASYEMALFNSFAGKLGMARKNAGLKRKQLAEKAGISVYTLEKYEAGYQAPKPEDEENKEKEPKKKKKERRQRHLPPFDVAIRLAAACDVSVNTLVPDKLDGVNWCHNRDLHNEQYIQYMLRQYFKTAKAQEKRRILKYITYLYQGKEADYEPEHAEPGQAGG